MRFIFADHINGTLVFSQPEIDGVPHLAGARPFGKLHFGDQREFDPGRYSLIVHLPGERRFGRLQPYKLAVKLLKRGVAEARADMPDIAPGVAIADRKDEGSEEGARFLRSRKSRDHDSLALRGFALEPLVRAGARQIFAACAFCHDAFKALAPGFLKEHRSESLAVAAEGNEPVFGKNGFQALLALDQRHRAQILAVLEHEIDTGRRRVDIALSPPANGPRGSGQD